MNINPVSSVLDRGRHSSVESAPAPLETSAAAPFQQARQNLIEVFEERLAGAHAARHADHLLTQALHGGMLRISDASTADLLAHLPAKGWAALQQWALAQGHAGITQLVCDGVPLMVTRQLLSGLRQLCTLERIDIEALSDRVDFAGLAKTCPRLERINFVGQRPAPLLITVPCGVKVSAMQGCGPARQKSRVFHKGSDGRVGPPCALHGQVYDHTAADAPGMGPGTLARQIALREIELNGAAVMQATDPDSGAPTSMAIKCRHLAMTWLSQRAARHAWPAKAPALAPSASPSPGASLAPPSRPVRKHDFYAGYTSSAALTSQVPGTAEDDYHRMKSRGAGVLFEAGMFGPMIQDQMSRMHAGESRYFALGTPKHMLGLELKVKYRLHGGVRQREYVINLYDPNITATHQRLVVVDFARLGTMRLSDWMSPERLAAYFPPGRCVGSLYTWPVVEGAHAHPVAARSYVSEAVRASGAFLHAAVTDGQAGHVRQAVAGLLARAGSLGPQRLEFELAGVDAEVGAALPRSVYRHRGDALAEYVAQLLAVPDDVLARDAKLRLVTAANGMGAPVPWTALSTGRSESLAAYLRAVLEAPDDALTAQERLRLLLAEFASWPILSGFCMMPTRSPATPQALAVNESMRTYVRLIAQSSLPFEHKMALCNPVHAAFRLTPAEAALKMANPRAAAAIVIGVLESDADSTTRHRLLDALRVNIAELPPLLTRQGDPANWAARVDALMQDLPPPPAPLEEMANASFLLRPEDTPMPQPVYREETTPPRTLSAANLPLDRIGMPISRAMSEGRQASPASRGLFQRIRHALTAS